VFDYGGLTAIAVVFNLKEQKQKHWLFDFLKMAVRKNFF
jgi:hypothetical protein